MLLAETTLLQMLMGISNLMGISVVLCFKVTMGTKLGPCPREMDSLEEADVMKMS